MAQGRPRRRLLSGAAVAVLGLLAFFGQARPAAAHLHLAESEPASGTQVSETPSDVVLTFSEDVKAKSDTAALYGPDAKKITTSEPAQGTTSKEVTLALPPGLASGTYTVKWKATGADGHPKDGTISFTLARDGTAGPDTATEVPATAADLGDSSSTGGPPAAITWLLSWAMFGASFLAIGAVVFLAWIHDGYSADRRRLVSITRFAAWGAAAAATAQFLVFAVAVGFGTALDSSFAIGIGLALAGLTLIGVGAPSFMQDRAAASAVAGAGLVLVAFLFIGHPASVEPWWLVAPATVLHTAAASVWFGGLVCLLVSIATRPRTQDAVVSGAQMVARFSSLAAWVLVAAVAGGAILAAIQLGSPLKLVTSAYGWVLLFKLAFVGLVLLVARYNREVLVPRVVERADPRAWARLGRTVRTESLGLVLAIALSAALASMAPPGG